MTTVQPRDRHVLEAGFPRLLREWRGRRRVSQLELSVRTGVSQRHVSFLESGRSTPSRKMVLLLSGALDVPLRERNAWLDAAGFNPLFRSRPLGHPQMAEVARAVSMMLKNHEPFPAVAIDRAWNIAMANGPFDRMAALLGDTWARVGGQHRNLMRLFFHPQGIRPLIVNWESVSPLLWRRAEREADERHASEMRELLDELAPYQNEATVRPGADDGLVPVMPIVLDLGELRLSFFTVIATFGTAQDITADELRIESLFPADSATHDYFRPPVG